MSMGPPGRDPGGATGKLPNCEVGHWQRAGVSMMPERERERDAHALGQVRPER